MFKQFVYFMILGLTGGLLLFGLSLPAAADTDQAEIGTIIEVEGTATIARAGQVSEAAIDSPVFLNDTVETGATSKLHVLFTDETEITLGENARLTLDEYVFDDEQPDKGRYSILRGAFLFASGLMEKNDQGGVSIDTAYGSLGLRGTTIWGGDVDEEYGIYVSEGEIEVVNPQGQSVVRRGEGVTFQGRNRPPGKAFTWPEEKRARAQKKVALKRRDFVREKVKARRQVFKTRRESRRENRRQLREQNRPRGDQSPLNRQEETRQEETRGDRQIRRERLEDGQTRPPVIQHDRTAPSTRPARENTRIRDRDSAPRIRPRN